jgi:pentapeptide MXKDX repeat protein
MEKPMKKILIAAALALMCSSAFAQGTGPAAQQDNMTKPGMTNNSTDKSSMDKGTTTGMNDGMKKEGMSNSSMSKDGMKNESTTKDGMKK